MQDSTGSMRATHRGTRFVSPASTGRHAHPLSRGHSPTRPVIPRAARAAAERDPVGALRRCSRGVAVDAPGKAMARQAIRPATIRWSRSRRSLRGRRSFRAVPRPR